MRDQGQDSRFGRKRDSSRELSLKKQMLPELLSREHTEGPSK